MSVGRQLTVRIRMDRTGTRSFLSSLWGFSPYMVAGTLTGTDIQMGATSNLYFHHHHTTTITSTTTTRGCIQESDWAQQDDISSEAPDLPWNPMIITCS